MPLEHRFIETNGVRLHVAVDGTGPLVVLLHGFPECWYSWRNQIAALAPHYRVVVPDLRGYNESDKPTGVSAYAMPELIADVDGLIRAFGETEAIIVGHDWGGIIAWSFAMERPTMTRKLCVMNVPHPARFQEAFRTSTAQLAKSWYVFFFQIPWLPERLLTAGHARAIGNMFEKAMVDRSAMAPHDIATLRDAATRPGAMTSAINYYRAAFRSPEATAALPAGLRRFLWGDRPAQEARTTRADYPKIASPTLLIWGEEDIALTKELTYDMADLFTGPFAIKYVPRCGHFVQQERPELVNEYLLEFLADQPRLASPA